MVKVLHIHRDGKYHSIKEVATSVQLTLRSKKDYLRGDNSDIIPTDTIKNTVHVLAKLKGVQSCFNTCCFLVQIQCKLAQGWNLLILSSHFLLTYFYIYAIFKFFLSALKFSGLQKSLFHFILLIYLIR